MASHGVTMNICQACKRQAQLYLCDDCETTLANMLDQIPWLLDELDARIQGMDRIPHGTIGRQRRPHEMSVIDFDACETARETRKMLQQWVETVTKKHTGRIPPGLDTNATRDFARWLQVNTAAIARLDIAGALYHDINKLVGASHKGGQLVTAINPIEHHLVGPCPTITGRHRDGTPRECGRTLFADTYDRSVYCPDCAQDIDVETTRRRAAETRDLQTKAELIDILTNIDEPVTGKLIDQWIKARRLRPRGYLHDGSIIELQIDPSDPPVYSVERARKLRRRDGHLRTIRRVARAT